MATSGVRTTRSEQQHRRVAACLDVTQRAPCFVRGSWRTLAALTLPCAARIAARRGIMAGAVACTTGKLARAQRTLSQTAHHSAARYGFVLSATRWRRGACVAGYAAALARNKWIAPRAYASGALVYGCAYRCHAGLRTATVRRARAIRHLHRIANGDASAATAPAAISEKHQRRHGGHQAAWRGGESGVCRNGSWRSVAALCKSGGSGLWRSLRR